ncbi:MAG TPA: methyltransferase domain-containing protein [Rhodopila sp.]|uniref:methyltransferase domain-containing protein n=1 Tax=Rhodopila sp. TaxID=2480087 RepID=UPI002B54B639|nr:methyltransferase domain-containing protein [Rhodopila sp.]HVY17751.1 methyltransferase domain-containing protein [Rhodopila sp.]
MTADAHFAAQFYGSARGAVTARVVRERVGAIWPSAKGEAVLGIGYAIPYLRLWHDEARRCVAVTPAQLGAVRWPSGTANLSCTAEEDSLPFADVTFDRVLLVHGLEVAESARRLLREAWRVLKDDGRLMIVSPNRAGMWAYWDGTPFGHGQPYSAGQLNRLLANGLFRVERREACLWMPPAQLRILLRSAPLFERAGRKMAPGLAGVLVTEAVKDVYAAMPIKAVPRRRLVLADAA